jgi:hypothetical protein
MDSVAVPLSSRTDAGKLLPAGRVAVQRRLPRVGKPALPTVHTLRDFLFLLFLFGAGVFRSLVAPRDVAFTVERPA